MIHSVLRHRIITGPILIAVFLAVVWLDDWLETVALSGDLQAIFLGHDRLPRGLALFIASMVAVPIAAWELSRIVTASGIPTRRWLMIAAASIGLVLTYVLPALESEAATIAIMGTGMILVFVASLLVMSRSRTTKGAVAAAGAVVFGFVYLGLTVGFYLLIRRDHSAWWIVGVMLTTKSCDIGAYFTGRAIGRHKMIPWLSPGKTWEGLAGGVAAATLVGLGLAWLSHAALPARDHAPLWLGAVSGVIFALVGQAGDLTMSLFKRGAGMKDSSQILPGMGGVLDVLDSALLVAPVAYWLFLIAGMVTLS